MAGSTQAAKITQTAISESNWKEFKDEVGKKVKTHPETAFIYTMAMKLNSDTYNDLRVIFK